MRKNENEMDFTNKNDIEDIVNNVNYLTSDNNNIEKLIQIKKDLNEFKEIKKLKEEIASNENYINLTNKDRDLECFITEMKDIKESINDKMSESEKTLKNGLLNHKSQIELNNIKSVEKAPNIKFNSIFRGKNLSKLHMNNNSVLSEYRKNIMKDKVKVLTELDDLEKLSVNFRKSLLRFKLVNGNFKLHRKCTSQITNLKEKKVLVTDINIKSTENETHGKTFPNQFKKELINNVKNEKLISEEIINFKAKDCQPERIKTFKVKFINNWFCKNGFSEPSAKLGLNFEFQTGVIRDQIKVILDSLHYFRTSYLNSKETSLLFNNFTFSKQRDFNKILEETCGLMMEICTIILVDFYDYMPQFVAIQPPNPSLLKDKKTVNEYNSFIANTDLFSKCNAFLKGCLDVYEILIKQVDDMHLTRHNYTIVQQYLSRTRYNVSNMIFSMKNAKKSYEFDQKILTKYSFKGYSLDLQSNVSTKKPPIPKLNRIFDQFKQERDIEIGKYTPMVFKINEDKERQRRLNAVLKLDKDLNNSFQLKKQQSRKKNVKEFENSKIINKLMKYCPKEIKNKITSQRIIEKYNDNKDDEN